MRDDDVRSACFAALDVLKAFHGTTTEAPSRRLWRPDSERLAVRFERFNTAGAV